MTETNFADRPSRGAQLVARMEVDGEKRAGARKVEHLRHITPYLLRRRSDLLLAGLFLILAAATTLALPALVKQLIDHGFHGGADSARVNTYFLALLGVAISMAIASACRFYYVTKIGERVVADIRADVFDHLMGLSPSFYTRLRTGEALSRLTTDATLIETLVGSSASFAIRNGLMMTGALIMMMVTSWKLTCSLLLIIPLVLLPMFAFGRRVRALSVASQDRLADASAAAAESLDGLETVQAFGNEDWARSQFRGAIEAAFTAARKRIQARSWMTFAAIAVIFCGVSCVLWFGAHAVVRGEMTGGDLAQFVFLAVLAAGGGGAFAEVWGDIQKAAGATQRLAEILQEKPDIAAPPAPLTLPTDGRGEIAFERVSFAYPAADERSALHEFSLTVRPGETVALVGPSGAGKSTVFRLLLRFYDPVSGAVRMDEIDARDVDPRKWRSRFAYVAQEAPLFSGSALDNIRLGRLDADEAAAESAARRAEAWSFISARGGLMGALGDRGRGLSGGERQRIAVARALVRDAPILLLDEATSALDAENERLVQKALNEARSGRTTLIIAHRLATVLQADRIVVMDNGRVVEEGRHSDLLARGGLYARLASLQFQKAA